MPEERGLYQDIALERCLIYVGAIKGLPKAESRRRLAGLLHRFDLAAHRKKEAREMSKGMQQKGSSAPSVHAPDKPRGNTRGRRPGLARPG